MVDPAVVERSSAKGHLEGLSGFLLPPFGFVQALGHTLQAVRNARLRKYLMKELQLNSSGLKVGEPTNT